VKARGRHFIEVIMAVVLIGIDDTDNQTSSGTGRLARRLVEDAIRRGAKSLGSTRHQFLVDERIPYTRQNRGICVAVEWTRPVSELCFAMDLIAEWSAVGSDPGVCIAATESVGSEVTDWGIAATREVLTMKDAARVADAHGMLLHPLGGSGQGIIGALAGVGLRAGGNDGRFVDLPGLRELGEYVSGQELAELGIEVKHLSATSKAVNNDRYKTLDWVRPRLVQGKAVWPVEWSDEHHAWISVDRKKNRSLEPGRS
jgi:hypothetical protein